MESESLKAKLKKVGIQVLHAQFSSSEVRKVASALKEIETYATAALDKIENLDRDVDTEQIQDLISHEAGMIKEMVKRL